MLCFQSISFYLRPQSSETTMRIENHLSTVGLLFGTLFFALSLSPSLLPRGDAVQGIISGISLAAGYGLGVISVWLWRYLELPRPRERIQHFIYLGSAALCGLLVVSFLWQASHWQNRVRVLMGMEMVDDIRALLVGSIALLIFLAALLIGKLFHQLQLILSRKLRLIVPRRISHAAGLLMAFAVFWAVIDGVLISFALHTADISHQQIDARIDPELEPPTAPVKTGSAASLIAWKDMGRQGRRFISEGPLAKDIERLSGAPALDPIRVYVGLNAAETPRERAELALEELKRVGGFERSMLVLIAPTGTGWIDPAGIEALEYLYRGDVASVAAQYSYLPSALSLMAKGAYGVETTRALFQAVYGHWTQLPRENRPALYIFGLSLGALHSDRSFDFYDIINDPFNGALWSGPPFRTGTWRTATDRRHPESPEWLPHFRNGSVIRFANQQGGLEVGNSPWGDFRIVFLQYASDPITFFSPATFYREPDWMKPPRGPDVSEDLRWFPVVTMLQLIADMIAGTAPAGYGHEYAVEHYLDAWFALTEPEGWNEHEFDRLRKSLANKR